MPLRYLFEPWKAPLPVQQKAKCIVGVDYPKPMVDHQKASKECLQNMKAVKDALMGKGKNSLWHDTCTFIYLHVHQIMRFLVFRKKVHIPNDLILLVL